MNRKEKIQNVLIALLLLMPVAFFVLLVLATIDIAWVRHYRLLAVLTGVVLLLLVLTNRSGD